MFEFNMQIIIIDDVLNHLVAWCCCLNKLGLHQSICSEIIATIYMTNSGKCPRHSWEKSCWRLELPTILRGKVRSQVFRVCSANPIIMFIFWQFKFSAYLSQVHSRSFNEILYHNINVFIAFVAINPILCPFKGHRVSLSALFKGR